MKEVSGEGFVKVYSWLSYFYGMIKMSSDKHVADNYIYEQQRQRMVKHINGELEQTKNYIGIYALSHAIEQAFLKVPRHKFVSPEDEGEAYNSHPLPIGCGQTISQPFIVAFMTELLSPGPSDKILEIGTGSGYQDAILSELVAEVFTIEIIPELSEQAEKRLQRYKNVFVRTGDGANGWPEKAPFDGIIVTAASETIPLELLNQLKPHGRLAIPLGKKGNTQMLTLVIKVAGGGILERPIIPVRFVPFI